MATTTTINGRVTAVPQASASVDANGLETPSPNSSGIVAFVGVATGGEPLTARASNDVSSPNALRKQYQGGDLRTAGLFAFAPSNDEAIPEGATKIVPVKVNPSTQSSAVLVDGDGADAIDLLSQDYGLRENQISVEVEAGTVTGKLITLTREDSVEVFDNVGGGSAFDVEYTPGSAGYATMVGRMVAAGFEANATRADVGRSSEMAASVPVGFPSLVRVQSNDPGDALSATIYGIVGGAPAQERVSFEAGGFGESTQVFQKVLGVVLSEVPAGGVGVTASSDGSEVAVLIASLSAGVVLTANTPAAGVLTATIDTNVAADYAVFGRSAAGASVGEIFDMTSGAAGVTGVRQFAEISVIALGDLAAARTVTLSLPAIRSLVTEQTTAQQLEDYLNALPGIAASALMDAPRAFLTSTFDYSSFTNLLGAPLSLSADLQAVLEALSASLLVTATRSSGGSSVPADTASVVFLQGAIEGVPLITHWQQAFDLLRCRDVNIIVPLSSDPAVWALALQHLVDRSGRYARQGGEANGYVGVSTLDGSADTLANIRAAVRVLQGRHLSFLPQPIERADPETGILTVYPPYMHAAIAAGMQAGSSLAEPLTRKKPAITNIFDGPDWTVEDDDEVLIQSGLFVGEQSDKGIYYLRSITGHIASNNLAYVEMSMNEAANHFTKGLREYLDERMVGSKGANGTEAQVYALAEDYADRQINVSINSWRALQIEVTDDAYSPSIEIAPIGVVNFIPIRISLVRNTQAA